MKLKVDDAGHAVLKDGHPIYVHEDGKELPFDAAGTVATINRLNDEAKGHRLNKERAEAALKVFEGIDDPAAARKAIETVKNMDLKQLVDSGEVQKVKDEAARAFQDQLKSVEEKYKPVVKERDGLKQSLINEMVGNAFARSKFITEKIAVPVDMIQATFGSSFKVEDGKITGYQNGKQVFSRLKPGEVADFDEAMEIMVDAYPFKDHILKGSGANGGGANGGAGKGGYGTITRAQLTEWQANDPGRAAAEMAKVREGKATLVD